LLCSGKVYYDLAAEREKLGDDRTAIIRIEQLYPFPEPQVVESLTCFPAAVDIRWVQEEPENGGAWAFVAPRLQRMLGTGQILRYVGRPDSASTATGSHTIHQMEQRRLVTEAFG
jgi:2-oxoglutarate dehydrogenase E1 component